MDLVRVCQRQMTVPANDGSSIAIRLLQLNSRQYVSQSSRQRRLVKGSYCITLIACSQSVHLLATNDLRWCMYLAGSCPLPHGSSTHAGGGPGKHRFVWPTAETKATGDCSVVEVANDQLQRHHVQYCLFTDVRYQDWL